MLARLHSDRGQLLRRKRQLEAELLIQLHLGLLGVQGEHQLHGLWPLHLRREQRPLPRGAGGDLALRQVAVLECLHQPGLSKWGVGNLPP